MTPSEGAEERAGGTGGEATTADADPLLVAEDLVAGYLPDVDILCGCSLTIAGHEIVGIIGPNGAGKSTLVKTLFGLVPVRSGRVRLRGDDITKTPAHRMVAKGVGYVPQTAKVFGSLTVQENLEMGLYLRPKETKQRLAYVTDLFGLLARRRGQKAGSLSGGEQQILAMGRALMADPSVLLLDEPSAGLSPVNQDETFDQVRQINAAGVAVIIVEQNARRCLQLCHRGYVLDQGKNAYTGTGSALLHDEKVIELYLGTLARVQ